MLYLTLSLTHSIIVKPFTELIENPDNIGNILHRVYQPQVANVLNNFFLALGCVVIWKSQFRFM